MNTYEGFGDTFREIEKDPEHILDITVDAVFIGKRSPTGGYDGLKPRDAEGNSILVKKGANYMYIGSEIYAFAPVKGDTIEKYYSDIGNSDVAYPYAVGKTHIYIMLDKIAVEKSLFDMKGNIYQQYYEAETELPMYLKGAIKGKGITKENAKERIMELLEKTQKLKTKMIHKRL